MEVVITLIIDNMFGLVLPTTSATATPTPWKCSLRGSTAALWSARGVCARPFPSNLALHIPQEMDHILRHL